MSAVPDPVTDEPILSPLEQERDVVRRLEARLATEHGSDTPAYWRAMSVQLQTYLASPRFQQDAEAEPTEDFRRAYGWLARVATGYRALAATSVRR